MWRDFLFEAPVWGLLGIFYHDSGIKILEKDWKYMFICDACRYDMFRDTHDIGGELTSIRSRGGETGEFHKNNFVDDEYDDIVYVSATPRSNKFIRERVYEYIPVWEQEWDEETGLVPAERMEAYCIEAINQYPNKRVICHFLQPHLSIQTSEGVSGADQINFNKDKSVLKKFSEGKISRQFPGSSPWILYQEGYASQDELWELQKQKLDKFYQVVENILPYCEESTVITSDHGNCYGEKLHPQLPWRIYEHPKNLNHQDLRTVPWLQVDLSQYTEKTAEYSSTTNQSEITEDVAKERLRDLGYINE